MLPLGRSGGLLSPVIPGDRISSGLGQDLPGNSGYLLGVHIAHHAQHHVAGVIEGPVAVVEGLGGDMADALHRPGHGDPGGTLLIQTFHQVGVDLPVRCVLHHADLLADDALLLLHALVGEIGDGDELEQDLQVLIEVLGAVEIVGGDGVAGKGVGLGAVLRQDLEGVAVLGVKHFVLQIVGDARRGVLPLAVQLKAQVHPAVAGDEKGAGLGVMGLADDPDGQAVGQGLLINPLADLRVIALGHGLVASFPVRK